MRISDWSSDVCSSDLHGLLRSGLLSRPGAVQHAEASSLIPSPRFGMCGDCLLDSQRLAPFCGAGEELCGHSAAAGALSSALFPDPPARSEEHTSELQSLMRTSYAVFCLNKKTTTNH